MSIVFGTRLDGRDAEAALVAARLAKRLEQPLQLVHVSQDARAHFVLGTREEGVLGPVRAALREEAARLRREAGCVVVEHLSAGDVAEALVALARLEVAVLLCVGGRVGAQRSWMGDTADKLARLTTTTPLLSLRQPERFAAWLDGARALRVLVGADHGQAASAARLLAVRLSQVGACEVEVAHVVLPRALHARLGLPAPANEHTLAPEAQAAALRDLERSAPEGERARLHVLPSPAGADAQLVMCADDGGHDVIVVGQRRSSLLEQLWYGSVARGVLQRAPVNVVCAPASPEAAQRRATRPAVVLVGVDLTPDAQRALAMAGALIADGGVLHLASALPNAEDDRAAAQEVWYALARMSPPGATLQVERHVVFGEPAEALLALAARVGAELIVLASRGQTTMSHVLSGSVASAVAASAPVPVLLVPPLPA